MAKKKIRKLKIEKPKYKKVNQFFFCSDYTFNKLADNYSLKQYQNGE